MRFLPIKKKYVGCPSFAQTLLMFHRCSVCTWILTSSFKVLIDEQMTTFLFPLSTYVGHRYVVLDVPLLFETRRLTQFLNHTVVVYR